MTAPTYRPEHYDESIEQLLNLVKSQGIQRIAGTSMGGYYALKLAELTGLPVLAVNPCFEPAHFFNDYCQFPVISFATNEIINIDQSMVSAFTPIDSHQITHPRIIIGRNDTVIPADYQREFCRQQGWSFIETDWGHRIEDPLVIVQQLTSFH